MGLKALRQNTTGASNTAVGLDALFSNRRELGDLHTLADRISAEVAEANTVVSLIALVGAWSRKPATADSARSEAVARQRE